MDDTTATSQFGLKFGLPPEQVGEVAFAAHSLQIPVHGLSFHVGSGSKNPAAYEHAIGVAKETWEKLRRGGVVQKMKILDLGGGWSSEEKPFLAAAAHVKKALSYGEIVERVIAEPGRFFAAPTHHL